MVFGVQTACTFRVGVVRGLLGVFLQIMDFLRYAQSGDSKKRRAPEGDPVWRSTFPETPRGIKNHSLSGSF